MAEETSKVTKVEIPKWVWWLALILIFGGLAIAVLLAVIGGKNVQINFGKDLKPIQEIHQETRVIHEHSIHRKPIGAFAHRDVILEELRHDKTLECFDIEIVADVLATSKNAHDAMMRRDRLNAISYAAENKNAAERLMSYSLPLSDSIKEILAESCDAFCEAAWYRKDYAGMHDFVSRIVEACGFPPPIRALAYKRLSELMLKGRYVYLPSLNELEKLKSYGKDKAYAYLNLFAKWGFLHSRKVDPFTHEVLDCDYKKIFGFDKDLEYCSPFKALRYDKNGICHESNELMVAARGLWSWGMVDLTAAFDAYRGAISSNDVHVTFDVAMTFEEQDRMLAYQRVVVTCDFDEQEDKPAAPSERVELPDYTQMVADMKFEGIADCPILNDKNTGVVLQTADVPEPSSASLLACAFVALLLRRRQVQSN